MKLIKKLSGHSGCQLNLYQEDEQIFLRKDAGNANYNRRLKKQFIKQKCFHLDEVKTPQTFSYGTDEKGLFYFDMEYVNGITLSEYMNQIKIKEIIDFIEILFRALPIQKSKLFLKANTLFQNKINALAQKLPDKNENVQKSMDLLKRFDFSKVPLSACCGDLTLENIIISSKGIYIIDLLDSFYNSWMVDIAKLLQDLELGWSYRHQKRDFGLNLRLATAKEALMEHLSAMPNGPDNIRMIYHILLLNLLRIYPYAKDKTTFDFLDEALLKIIMIIKEEKR